MSIIGRWRKQVSSVHAADRKAEEKHRIASTEEKTVSPADIERLEEEMVPWLRAKRRKARQQR